VTQGDAVLLHCPLYHPSLPEHITWIRDAYDEIALDKTKAISDNGSRH